MTGFLRFCFVFLLQEISVNLGPLSYHPSFTGTLLWYSRLGYGCEPCSGLADFLSSWIDHIVFSSIFPFRFRVSSFPVLGLFSLNLHKTLYHTAIPYLTT